MTAFKPYDMRTALHSFPIVYFEEKDTPRRLIEVAHPCTRVDWHDMEDCGICCTNVWIQIDEKKMLDEVNPEHVETGLYEIEVRSPFSWNDNGAMASLLTNGDLKTTLAFLDWLGIMYIPSAFREDMQ